MRTFYNAKSRDFNRRGKHGFDYSGGAPRCPGPDSHIYGPAARPPPRRGGAGIGICLENLEFPGWRICLNPAKTRIIIALR